MVHFQLGYAFGGVILTLFVFLQLLIVLQHTGQSPTTSFNQNLNQWRNRANAATDNDLFLVGAGKADVTG